MEILSAIRKMFTSPYSLKPEEWLRAIPLLQDALRESLPLHLVTLEDIRNIRNLFDALEALLLVKVELDKEAREEGLPYPIKLSSPQFSLICNLLYLQPLSEEDLAKVQAGFPALIAPPGGFQDDVG